MPNFEDTRLPPRFWDKVSPCPMSGCWLWTGSASRGYGKLGVGSKRNNTRAPRLAHRISYEALVGSIPHGMQIDHLCRTPACCNPAHLEPVSPAENVRRGLAGVANSSKTHCPKGHEYSDENTFFIPNKFRGGMSRACRACKRELSRARRARGK